MKPIRVLLSSAGAKTPLLQALRAAVKRLQPQAEVIAGDSSPPVVSQYFADSFWHMPPTLYEYQRLIVEELKKRQVTHILPSRDGELLFWAKQRELLASLGIQVLVAPEAAVRLCLDKYTFAQKAAEYGSTAIPTLLQPDTHSSTLWVVKERYGAGSKQLGLKLGRQEAMAYVQRLRHPVFQPFIEGKEISIDAWLSRHSQLKGHIYRYRTKVEHGESQISQTTFLPEYDAQIKQLLESLKLTGPVVLQAIIDTEHKLHIIECNSRFGGASTLGIKAGVDSLYWSLAEANGYDVNNMPFSPTTYSICQARYTADLYL